MTKSCDNCYYSLYEGEKGKCVKCNNVSDYANWEPMYKAEFKALYDAAEKITACNYHTRCEDDTIVMLTEGKYLDNLIKCVKQIDAEKIFGGE